MSCESVRCWRISTRIQNGKTRPTRASPQSPDNARRDVMAATEDRDTLGRARLSCARTSDIDEFVDMLSKFERGDIGPDEWRAFRLVRGTYGQRQTIDASMLRVKVPQGVMDVPQLEAMAEVAE